MCKNFEPRLRGVVFQLSWVTIHNIKPTHVDYYHVEGFKDCSMYSRKNLVLIIHTRDETPCRISHLLRLVRAVEFEEDVPAVDVGLDVVGPHGDGLAVQRVRLLQSRRVSVRYGNAIVLEEFTQPGPFY